MSNITLQVDGREISLEEIEAIVRQHFFKNATTAHENTEAVQGPTEGKWFEVNPQAINQELFQEKRDDKRQERTRQRILEAFTEMKNFPEKYGKSFKTMMPEKTLRSKTVEKLKKLASRLGDHNADWVEQALEWAQRIHNGESWEDVCSEPDTANWYRLVVWKDGYARLIGGSDMHNDDSPASDVGHSDYYSNNRVDCTVPLVVLYTK